MVCSPAYSWDCAEAVAIVQCESSGNPVAIGHGHFGWWQISEAVWRPFFGEELWAAVLGPVVNTEMAAVIYERAGRTWGPWGCRLGA